MFKKIKVVLYTTILATAYSTAYANADQKEDLGAGLIYENHLSLYKDTSLSDGQAQLYLNYQGERFSMNKDQWSYDLLQRHSTSMSIVVQNNGIGFESGDAAVFKGLDKRDYSLELGVQARYKVFGGELGFTTLKDVSDAHDSNLYKLSYKKTVSSGKLSLTPRVEAIRLSDNFVDYYYGVKRKETTANRAFYKGKQANVLSTGINAAYPISPRFKVVGDASVHFIPDEIENSPLTKDKSHNLKAFFGVEYKFK